MHSRDSFYGNLLKRVIVRIDYEDIISVEEVVKAIKKLFPETRQVQRFLNEEDFLFNDSISKVDIPIDIIKTAKCFGLIFGKERMESVVEINQFFIRIICLAEKNEYKRFEEEVLNKILPVFEKLKEYEKENLKIIRISVNKSNQAVFTSIDKIKKYFNPNLLMLNIFNRQIKWDKPQNGFNSNCNFIFNNIPVNMQVVFNRVKIDQRKAIYYRLYLNYESYNNSIDTKLDLKTELLKLNENCFDMFFESIKPLTRDILQNGGSISDYELD